jgi:hypothetical protein
MNYVLALLLLAGAGACFCGASCKSGTLGAGSSFDVSCPTGFDTVEFTVADTRSGSNGFTLKTRGTSGSTSYYTSMSSTTNTQCMYRDKTRLTGATKPTLEITCKNSWDNCYIEYELKCSASASTTPYPTSYPTPYPTPYPTLYPTPYPTPYPTQYPDIYFDITTYPTPYPTWNVGYTPYPTLSPTLSPTQKPTDTCAGEGLCKCVCCRGYGCSDSCVGSNDVGTAGTCVAEDCHRKFPIECADPATSYGNYKNSAKMTTATSPAAASGQLEV